MVAGQHRSESAGEFEVLLISHQGSLLRYITSIVGNHHEAEDVLQAVNLILWRKRAAFERGSNFRAWSGKVARFEVLGWLRRQRRNQRLVVVEIETESLPDLSPAAVNEEPDPLLALKECVGMLPPHDQELLLMRYTSDRTLDDYAKAINRSPGTLKARLFRIREVLRKNLEDRLQEWPRATAVADRGSRINAA